MIELGVYVANVPAVGEYQLAWQLSPKSIVQHGTKINVEKVGCLVCNVTLGPPEVHVKTEWRESSPFFQRAKSPKPAIEGPPDIGTSVIRSLQRERILDFSILWDEECLLSYDIFGLSIPSEVGEKLVFNYGRPDRLPENGPPTLTAMAVVPLCNGQIHGKVQRWTEDGSLLVKVPYRDGLIDGECQFFNRKGKLLETSTLKEGTGTYRIWDRNQDEPVLLKEVNYLDGKVQE